ncbi:MAG: radical SAM protein [Bacteroidetes bacterium]|nr:radical SAM protein [Bacteroidota bacterium]MBU1580531.1 radical SAM protein [Bacteroidota bacterium]MBU2557127.1 radical SAM protein [Bacteroidota bacterium]
MRGFLFDEMIFGPVQSRRLGVSLGINLLPLHDKNCNFNCIYCECGWTKTRQAIKQDLPVSADLLIALEQKLQELSGTEWQPESITFAGNGEPTMHPDFVEILTETVELKHQYAPKAVVSVLSNGSMLHKPEIFEALKLADNNILKLDGGTEDTIRRINMPLKAFRLNEFIQQLSRFNGNLTIQTLFVRGFIGKDYVDNTKAGEVAAWIKLLKLIHPKMVMIYTIERETALEGLERIPKHELDLIVKQVRENGLQADVFT